MKTLPCGKKEEPFLEVFLGAAAERSIVPPRYKAQWLEQGFGWHFTHASSRTGVSAWLHETELMARSQGEMALLKHG